MDVCAKADSLTKNLATTQSVVHIQDFRCSRDGSSRELPATPASYCSRGRLARLGRVTADVFGCSIAAATACPENIVKYYREVIAYVPDAIPLPAAGGRRRFTHKGLRLITFYSQMERFVFMMLPQCRFSAVVCKKRMVF
jgi:hypothetical protein